MTNQTQTVSTQTHVNHAKYYQNVSLSKATFYHEIEICFFIFIPCYYFFFFFWYDDDDKYDISSFLVDLITKCFF